MSEPPVNSEEPVVQRTLSPAEELAFRKATRRAIILAVTIVVVVFSAAGIIGTRAISRRFAGARDLDQAQELLKAADAVVLDVDQVVRAEANAEIAASARALGSRIPIAKSDLEAASRLVEGAMDSITEDEQRRALLLKSAAAARLEMLGPAQIILAGTAKAGDALEPSRLGWELLVAAEKLADDSVKQYNRLTKQSVAASSKLASQAEAELSKARSHFSEAATAFPEARFDRYLEYIDAKVILLSLSRQSNTLWLAGKLAEANAAIARYNTQDTTAVALAAALPESPGKAIADAYEGIAGTATKEYFSARESATKADAKLDLF